MRMRATNAFPLVAMLWISMMNVILVTGFIANLKPKQFHLYSNHRRFLRVSQANSRSIFRSVRNSNNIMLNSDRISNNYDDTGGDTDDYKDILTVEDMPAISKDNFIKDLRDIHKAITSRDFKKLQNSVTLPKIDYDKERELMKYFGVYHTDNFFESVWPVIQRMRMDAKLQKNNTKLDEINENYRALMEIGLHRRYYDEQLWKISVDDFKNGKPISYRVPIAIMAATEAVESFKQLQSKEEYLQELRMKELAKRDGRIFSFALRILPERFHKYVTYVRSLRCQSDRGDVIKNTVVSGLCGLFVLTNSQIQRIVQMYLVGLGASYSMLLVRNMPISSGRYSDGGNDPTGRYSFSSNAFYTAAALTLMLGPAVALALVPFIVLMPLESLQLKIKLALTASLLINSYFSTFFECYESSANNGSRWERARRQLLSEQEELKLEQVSNATVDLEQDLYEPDSESSDEQDRLKLYEHINALFGDDPHQDVDAKLLTQKPQTRSEVDKEILGGGADSMGKSYSAEELLKNTFLGVKNGFWEEPVPNWISQGYHEAQPEWKRGAEDENSTIMKYAKAEQAKKSLVEGPFGFRDRAPLWVDKLRSGLESDADSEAHKQFAREFGVYRRSMRFEDPEVVLRKGDGVSEESDASNAPDQNADEDERDEGERELMGQADEGIEEQPNQVYNARPATKDELEVYLRGYDEAALQTDLSDDEDDFDVVEPLWPDSSGTGKITPAATEVVSSTDDEMEDIQWVR